MEKKDLPKTLKRNQAMIYVNEERKELIYRLIDKYPQARSLSELLFTAIEDSLEEV